MKHVIGGTETVEGFIPYKNINGIDCPVSLRIHKNSPLNFIRMPQAPERNNAGDLIYIAPNGLKVVG